MPASPADSALYRRLFSDDETAALFTDAAEMRALLLVEGTLARVQGELGLIAMEKAAFIDRSAREVLIDPAALADDIAKTGDVIPALLAAFRKEMQAPEYAAPLHQGARSEDIIDTALALRLRRLAGLWQKRLAQPSAMPLAPQGEALEALGQGLSVITLRQAAPELRAAVAKVLNLQDLGAESRAFDAAVKDFAAWMAETSAKLHAIEADKAPLLAALTAQIAALSKLLIEAEGPEAGFIRSLNLPQIAILTGRALALSLPSE